jgi:lysophospholipase L1-like esterase
MTDPTSILPRSTRGGRKTGFPTPAGLQVACLLFTLIILRIFGSQCRADQPFTFGASEQIVFVGNDFFDHETTDCYIETALTARFPEKNLTFRNLGYSGDTVLADARALCAGWDNFGPPEQGFNRLQELIQHLQPTVVFVAYGMNESFAGQSGVADFQKNLDHLLDMLSANKARLVLISPIAHQTMPPPMADPSAHNRDLEAYAKILETTATKRGSLFIDLFHGADFSTTDGIHLTADGYRRAADKIEAALGVDTAAPSAAISSDLNQVGKPTGLILGDIKKSNGGVRFTATDQALPDSAAILHVAGLTDGQYELRAGDVVVASGSAADWAKGVSLINAPSLEQRSKLEAMIIRKNFDFFNYWRPQNDTYILGYRRHEQGRNAPEIAAFEKLAQDADPQIASLRAPMPVQYELRKIK